MSFAKPKKGSFRRYSSVDKYLQGVYYANKGVIDRALKDYGAEKASVYKKFKKNVKSYIEQGESPQQAVRSFSLTNFFETEKSRYNIYFLEGLKKYPEAYKKFRELTKEKGKYTKFDPEELYWNFKDKVYTYKGVMISFKTSPLDVEVERI